MDIVLLYIIVGCTVQLCVVLHTKGLEADKTGLIHPGDEIIQVIIIFISSF